MAIKFLHLADVHLDTPFKNREEDVRNRLREGVRQAFRNAIDLALDEQVDAVLVGGDLFDNATLSFVTEKFLLEQVGRLREREVPLFYAPGNHDPFGKSYRLGNIPWPDNVTIFNSKQPQTVELKDGTGHVKGIICGAGHENLREADNLASKFPRLEGGTPGIGLLHALVTNSLGEDNHERYAPCTLEDLRIDGYHYWALGHVHTRSELSDSPLVVYPGNIMGRHHREGGERGAYLVEIDDSHHVSARFHPLAPYAWFSTEVAGLEGYSNYFDLKDEIVRQASAALNAAGLNGRIMLRLILSGPCPMYQELNNLDDRKELENDLQNALDVECVEVDYASLYPMVDPENYRKGPHVLATALEIIQTLEVDDALLLGLAPEDLAGLGSGSSEEEKIAYLRSILTGLDVEAVLRMVEVKK